jgi:hypothetical protein
MRVRVRIVCTEFYSSAISKSFLFASGQVVSERGQFVNFKEPLREEYFQIQAFHSPVCLLSEEILRVYSLLSDVVTHQNAEHSSRRLWVLLSIAYNTVRRFTPANFEDALFSAFFSSAST